MMLSVFFIFFFVMRAWNNEIYFGRYSNCEGCFWKPTITHDLWLAALIFFFLALGWALPNRWILLKVIKFLFRFLGIALLLLVATDYVTNDIFHQRFLIIDFFRFTGDVKAGLSVIKAWVAPPYGYLKIVATVFFFATAFSILFIGGQRKKTAVLFCALAVICIAASMIMSRFPVRYIHEHAVWNVLEANRPTTRVKKTSAVSLEKALATMALSPEQCISNNEHINKPNIIVLLLESWSSWQSRLFGGSEDWTPHLDQIAQENHYLTQFYANGYMTSGGEISVITGTAPIPAMGELYAEYKDFKEDRFALPKIAQEAGVESAFITTSDLSFISRGDWLQAIHFETIEGSRHPFYEGMKRWQFDAPEDSALYARFLQWLETREDKRPFIAVMLTVSSHPPFINPETGKNDFEGTFRYMDKEAAHFYEALKTRGFFENGILMITGDHRTMTPLRSGEYEEYGARAFARIPMIVAGNVNMPQVVDAAFQQTDIAPSIAELLGLRVCRTPFMGSFLKENLAPSQYVVHTRGDDRDRIDVYYGANEVSGFRLNGDASHWMDNPPPDADLIAAWITTQRIRPRRIDNN